MRTRRDSAEARQERFNRENLSNSASMMPENYSIRFCSEQGLR